MHRGCESAFAKSVYYVFPAVFDFFMGGEFQCEESFVFNKSIVNILIYNVYMRSAYA